MGWFGKIAFGSLGMLLGGPLGAIAGAALGHHLVDKMDYAVDRRPFQVGHDPTQRPMEQAQAAYFVSMFSILAKLSKIDGEITSDEIAVVERFINSLPITEGEKQFAKQVFREAKDSPFSIDDFASQLYQFLRAQPAVMVSFFEILVQVAAADGRLHASEETALKRIKSIFHLTDAQYEGVMARHFNRLDKYYAVLNCTPQSSDQEIKSSYKKLVKEFHPDTIVSKGLPEEFINFATRRFQEIQDAYERVRKERSF